MISRRYLDKYTEAALSFGKNINEYFSAIIYIFIKIHFFSLNARELLLLLLLLIIVQFILQITLLHYTINYLPLISAYKNVRAIFCKNTNVNCMLYGSIKKNVYLLLLYATISALST